MLSALACGSGEQTDPTALARDGKGEVALGGQDHLRPRDMLRFGARYARRGVTADGERVLPEGRVRESR